MMDTHARAAESVGIPHSRPTLGSAESEAVLRVLDSGQLAQGPRVLDLETAVAQRLERRDGVACSSGTAALGLALAALGVGPGDDVVLSAFACSALADGVRFAGGRAVLADIGDDLVLDPRAALRRITVRTRAVVVVHPFGYPADLEPFLAWGMPVIEDCAQALGAERADRPAGARGTAAVCSLYATKMIAAGEGGMLVADSAAILAVARQLRTGGEATPGSFNHRLSDLHAAVALAQLGRLDEFVARRRRIADRYDDAFAGTTLQTPPRDKGVRHCFARYVVRAPDAAAFIAVLAAHGVEARHPVGDPLLLRSRRGSYPHSERAFSECVSLPLYPALGEGEIEQVIEAVLAAIAELGWQT